MSDLTNTDREAVAWIMAREGVDPYPTLEVPSASERADYQITNLYAASPAPTAEEVARVIDGIAVDMDFEVAGRLLSEPSFESFRYRRSEAYNKATRIIELFKGKA